MALGAAEARFERAVLRAAAGDTAGALADLAAYVASRVEPARLAEARALRATLEPALREGTRRWPGRAGSCWPGRPRRGGPRAGRAAAAPGLPAEALIELGRIAEYEERTADALDCHHRRWRRRKRQGERRTALDRIARIAARTPAAELPPARPLAAELQAARQAGVPGGGLGAGPPGRRRRSAGTRRSPPGERFLRAAAADDPLREEAARALVDLRSRAEDRQATQAARVRLGLVLAALALAPRRAAGAWRAGCGAAPCDARSRGVPDLYPEVALVTAEIRHDVLKHRASALGMLGTPDAPASEVARALLEPTPRLGRGRRPPSSGCAGPRPPPASRCARWRASRCSARCTPALARAEALLAGSAEPLADCASCGQLDRELREQHGPALAGAARRGAAHPARSGRGGRLAAPVAGAGDRARPAPR